MVLDQTISINRYFEEIASIPHGSFHEEKIADYIEQFAKDHQLKYIRDKYNDVIIYKKASKGYEDHETVMLQAHIDMVCEKNNDVDFDFSTDGLKLYIEDGWLHARGTTLGADDGVGVAYMLSILEDITLKHPALECVFTVQEEVGLIGAMHMKADYFKATRMINLDGGGEVSTTTTSSGGRYQYIEREVMLIDNQKPCYQLSVTGLLGGHSGGCIDLERGNSIKIAFRVMNDLLKNNMDIQLGNITGGLKENAIPRECIVEFASNSSFEQIENIINKSYKEIYGELEFSDKDVTIKVSKINQFNQVMCPHCSHDIIKIFYLIPNGFMHKSMAMPGLTYASMNLGKIRVEENKVLASYCTRSPLESMKNEMCNQVSEIAEIFGAKTWIENDFCGWGYVENSPLRNKLKEILAKQGKELECNATHGGLETGIFKGILPDLDIITYGPIAYGCHTPDEKLDLSSYLRSYNNLLLLLEVL